MTGLPLVIAARPRPLRRPKVARQRDSQDCGAAALATVCAYFGNEPSLSYLRRLSRISLDGTSMYALVEAAEALGLQACGVNTEFEELPALRMPAIVALDYHFVVLDRVDDKGVLLGDPAVGWRRVTREEFCQRWDGTLLLLDAGPDFPTASLAPRKIWPELWRLTTPLHKRLVMILSLTVALNVASLTLPILTQIIVDRLINGRPSELTLAGLLPLVVLVLAVTAVVEIVRNVSAHRASLQLQLHVGRRLTSHLLRLPLRYFLARQTGDSVNRVDEIHRLSDFVGSRGAQAFVDSVLAVLAVVIVWYYSPVIGLILAVSGLTLLATSFGVGRFVYSKLLRALQLQSEALTVFIEAVRRVALLKSYDAEPLWVERWYQKTAAAGRVVIRAQDVQGALGVVAQLAFRATPLVVVLIGFGSAEALSVGAVVALTSLASVALMSLLQLSGHYLEAQQVLLGIDRILDVLHEDADLPLEPRPRAGPAAPGALVEVRDLSFSYGGSQAEPVLRGIRFEVRRGETLAFIGRSGSGKTTLAFLLCRLLRATSGEILLGGRPLDEMPFAEIRRRVALVPQEAHLIRGTILENIALGDPNPDRERARRAARLAQATEFIVTDARGLDRMISEDGVGLSAGQRQRLAIARALYRDPEVLILDEPTSALDSESERALMQALRSLQRQRAIIVIAHRLQTVRHVDELFVLEEGRIVESGPPSELMARRGRYHELVTADNERMSLFVGEACA